MLNHEGEIIPKFRLRNKQIKHQISKEFPLNSNQTAYIEYRRFDTNAFTIIKCEEYNSLEALKLLEKSFTSQTTALIVEDQHIQTAETEYLRYLSKENNVQLFEAVVNPINPAVTELAGLSEKDAILTLGISAFYHSPSNYQDLLNTTSFRFNVDCKALQEQIEEHANLITRNNSLLQRYLEMFESIQFAADTLTWYNLQSLKLIGNVLGVVTFPHQFIFNPYYVPDYELAAEQHQKILDQVLFAQKGLETQQRPRLYHETIALLNKKEDFEKEYQRLVAHVNKYPRDEIATKKLTKLLSRYNNDFNVHHTH